MTIRKSLKTESKKEISKKRDKKNLSMTIYWASLFSMPYCNNKMKLANVYEDDTEKPTQGTECSESFVNSKVHFRSSWRRLWVFYFFLNTECL